MFSFRHFIRLAALCALGIICLSSCPEEITSWQSVSCQGLPDSNGEYQTLLFFNDSNGLLAGSEWQDSDLLANELKQKQVAVVYRTATGGHSWSRASFGRGGRFVVGTQMGKTVYLVRFAEQYEPRADTSQLICSRDGGVKWQWRGKIPGLITQVEFANERNGFAITNQIEHGNRLIYTTANGGLTWQRAAWKLPPTWRGLYSPNGTAWFLSAPNSTSYFATQLVGIDSTSHKATIEMLPNGRADSFACDEAGNLWFASNDTNGSLRLIKRDVRSGTYTDIHTFMANGILLDEAIHVSGRSISLLASISDKDAGLNHYHFYHSGDAGQTWQEEKLPVTYLVAPYCFLGPDRAWLSAGSPRLQVRH